MAKTYNTFTNVSAGSVLTASDYNNVLENVGNYRVPPMCQVYRSSDLTSYSSAAAISWNAEAFDTDGMWSSGTNVTVNTTGVYHVNFYYYFSGSATISSAIALLNVDGVNVGEQHSVVTSGVNVLGSLDLTLSLTATDVLTAAISASGGSAYIVNGDASTSNQQSRLTVTWIGQAS